jgi:DNA transformation protein and related proteins
MPDDTFKEFVLDQLSTLPDLRAQAMFGGHGLYSGANFFGILIAGRLYFKVDEASRVAYVERGMKPFTYTQANKVLAMKYYEVPPDILEDRELAIAWAKQSIHLAAATAGKKRARPGKKPR